ncbi:MAG: phage integrase central domain-containing protein [Acidimicrobiales bacterium]
MTTRRRQFGRIRKLPSGRYQARYPNGIGRDLAAPATFPTKADAAVFLSRVQTDMERGAWRDPRLGLVTFGAWAQQWLTANPAKRSTTLARDQVVLNTHLLPSLGARSLASITPAHVKGCVDAMAAKLPPATVRTNVGVLKAIMNAAVDADLLTRSPVRNLRLSSGPPRQRPTLTLGELSALAEATPRGFRALVLAAGLLGLRWSEAAGLRVRDVDRRALLWGVTGELAAGGAMTAPKSGPSDCSKLASGASGTPHDTIPEATFTRSLSLASRASTRRSSPAVGPGPSGTTSSTTSRTGSACRYCPRPRCSCPSAGPATLPRMPPDRRSRSIP